MTLKDKATPRPGAGEPSPGQRNRGRLVRLAIVLIVAAVAVGGFRAVDERSTMHGTAYFDSVVGIYPGDKVRILGIPVGEITDIEAQQDRVRVDFTYDGKNPLPADVHAAIVSPTLVSTRFLQLAPAYTGGATMPDGGEIPLDRTIAPLEFDDLKAELSRISTTLGPDGKGSPGVLSEFVATAAKAGKGRGAQFNAMITELSSALETLSQGRGDIFGTIRNLQVFIGAAAALDQEVVTFNRRMAGVSDLLDDNGTELDAAIIGIDRAARAVDGFLAEARPSIGRSTRKLTRLTDALAESRDDLATVLHVGPNTLTNFGNIYSSRQNALTGVLWFDNLRTPGQALCTLVSQQLAAAGQVGATCASYLGPLLDQLGIDTPDVGVGPPVEQPQPEQQPGDPQLDPGSTLDDDVDGLLDLLLPGSTQ